MGLQNQQGELPPLWLPQRASAWLRTQGSWKENWVSQGMAEAPAGQWAQVGSGMK